MFSQLEPLQDEDQRKLGLLRSYLKGLKNVCIAYSGGVDSTLVAAIANEQLHSKSLAITGVSPALAPHLLQEARAQAKWLGIRHQECETNELEDESYKNNPRNRCYTCKKVLHQHLKSIAKMSNNAQVIDGVNHDDLNDFRPGINAAQEAGVLSPLAELHIKKDSIRQISRALGLPWWDKPAQPCLSSRFPYGEIITATRLQQVSQAEEWIRSHGYKNIRVRSQGLAARIELPEDQINNFIMNFERQKIVKKFLSIGFSSVSLDLEGLISGKLNRN